MQVNFLCCLEQIYFIIHSRKTALNYTISSNWEGLKVRQQKNETPWQNKTSKKWSPRSINIAQATSVKIACTCFILIALVAPLFLDISTAIANISYQVLSSAPSAFISSKNAMYESSILCPFGADDEVDSGFTMVGATGLAFTVVVDSKGFGFALGAAVSLLTRTDAGT